MHGKPKDCHSLYCGISLLQWSGFIPKTASRYVCNCFGNNSLVGSQKSKDTMSHFTPKYRLKINEKCMSMHILLATLSLVAQMRNKTNVHQ